jgi:hypothetical protein
MMMIMELSQDEFGVELWGEMLRMIKMMNCLCEKHKSYRRPTKYLTSYLFLFSTTPIHFIIPSIYLCYNDHQ